MTLVSTPRRALIVDLSHAAQRHDLAQLDAQRSTLNAGTGEPVPVRPSATINAQRSEPVVTTLNDQRGSERERGRGWLSATLNDQRGRDLSTTRNDQRSTLCALRWLVVLLVAAVALVIPAPTSAAPEPAWFPGSASYTPVAGEIEHPNQTISRDEHTGEQGYKRVVRLFRGQTDRVVYLRIAKAASVQRGRSERHRIGGTSGGGDTEEGSDEPPLADDPQALHCTTEHPFWVVGRGWVTSGNLKVGDRLVGSKGVGLVVVGHEIRAEQADHFNFHVESWNTYFVAERESGPFVWVHNKGGKRDPGAAEDAFAGSPQPYEP